MRKHSDENTKGMAEQPFDKEFMEFYEWKCCQFKLKRQDEIKQGSWISWTQ
jgi:hypothetical protein